MVTIKEYKNKIWLETQIDKYKNVTDIAINTGYPITTLRRYIEKFGLNHKLENKKKIRKPDYIKYPYKDKEWLINALIKYKTPNEICRNTGLAETSIRRYISMFNLQNLIDINFKYCKATNYDKYPYKDKQWLIKQIELYQNVPSICKNTGYPETSVRRYIKHFHLDDLILQPPPNRRKQLNENYFENITTEHQAYWLGLITADGCVMNNRNSYCITLVLKKSDAYMLELFLQEIGSNSKVYINKNNIAQARVFSKKMFYDLQKYGICPRKTGNELFPSLRADIIKDFVRGFFDGDGTIYKKNKSRNKCTVGFTCKNEYFILNLLENIKKHIGINIPNYYKWQKDIYEPKTECYNSCLTFVKWIYDNSSIALIRKYEKAKNLLNYTCPSIERFIDESRLIAGTDLEPSYQTDN